MEIEYAEIDEKVKLNNLIYQNNYEKYLKTKDKYLLIFIDELYHNMRNFEGNIMGDFIRNLTETYKLYENDISKNDIKQKILYFLNEYKNKCKNLNIYTYDEFINKEVIDYFFKKLI